MGAKCTSICSVKCHKSAVHHQLRNDNDDSIVVAHPIEELPIKDVETSSTVELVDETQQDPPAMIPEDIILSKAVDNYLTLLDGDEPTEVTPLFSEEGQSSPRLRNSSSDAVARKKRRRRSRKNSRGGLNTTSNASSIVGSITQKRSAAAAVPNRKPRSKKRRGPPKQPKPGHYKVSEITIPTNNPASLPILMHEECYDYSEPSYMMTWDSNSYKKLHGNWGNSWLCSEDEGHYRNTTPSTTLVATPADATSSLVEKDDFCLSDDDEGSQANNNSLGPKSTVLSPLNLDFRDVKRDCEELSVRSLKNCTGSRTVRPYPVEPLYTADGITSARLAV